MVDDYRRKMIDYIKKNLSKGYTIDALRFALIDQGYSKIAIQEAIKKANFELAKKAPILKDKPIIKYEIIDEYDQPILIKQPWWKKLIK